MNLNYAIFRSEPIMTIPDLAQIGSHNKREKKAYQSNPNIKLELTKNNIELVPLNVKYVKGFDELTKFHSLSLMKWDEDNYASENTQLAKDFYEAGQQARQAEIDELNFQLAEMKSRLNEAYTQGLNIQN